MLSRGAGERESPASSASGNAEPQFNATLMFTDYQEVMDPAEPLELGVTAYQQGQEGAPKPPVHLDSGKHLMADMDVLSFWPEGTCFPLYLSSETLLTSCYLCCVCTASLVRLVPHRRLG